MLLASYTIYNISRGLCMHMQDQAARSKQTSKVSCKFDNEMLSNNYTMVSSRYKTNMYDGLR